MLDVRRLRLLHALASYGTVTAVGRALHLTGPAVSQQLAALEVEAGMKLVERDGRRLKLTEAGQVLVTHTGLVLDQLAAAEADLVALGTTVSGTVRVAAFTSAAGVLVARAWSSLRAEHGDHLRLRLVEMEPEESLPALERGEVDLAVALAYDLVPPSVPATWERHELLTEPLLAALPVGDPLHDPGQPGRTVALAALADRPWVVSRQDTACQELVQRACGAAGFVPRAVAQCVDFATTLELVGAGAGVAIVPRLAARHVPDGVALHPLAPVVSRAVFALTRRGGDRHPAVRVVLDHLVAAAAASTAAS
jgi:DNA-binding transcriptional LysR family regulator